MSKRTTTDEFIRRSTELHNGRYGYDKVVYKTTKDFVTITCPVHGDFEQKAGNHLAGRGCMKCRNEAIGNFKRKGLEQFIADARKVHGEKYRYDKVSYVNSETKVLITCPEHGDFEQAPSHHLSGRGCPECAKRRVAEFHKLGRDELLQRCREAHGDYYDYSEVDWSASSGDKVTIICPKHGRFKQIFNVHYSGGGCKKCATERNKLKTRMSAQEFLHKATKIHPPKYRYPRHIEDSKTPIPIECLRHGVFYQRPNDHLDGHGCPSCGRTRSYRSGAGNELIGYIEGLGFEVERERRVIRQKGLPKIRSDGYLPRFRLHIEHNGLRWHSTRFLENPNALVERLQTAKAAGDRMIIIHEDEWLHKPEVVKHTLNHILGMAEKVFARKCCTGEVIPDEAKSFYEQYHIQGCLQRPELSYGLYLSGELVACMSFSRKTSNRKNPYREGLWELVRFASKYAVVGGASKLFRHFVRTISPKQVVSFSMNHLFTGKMYENLGFVLDKELPPDYHYVCTKTIRRLHKSNFQHARLKQRFENYDPNLTEEQNCINNSLYRIYDCGKKRWLWSADEQNQFD